MSWLSKLAIRFIEHYQQNGGGKELLYVDCNFIPSCSEYAKHALYRFGFWQGGWLTLRRILRCNQTDLIQKIYDPIPEKYKEGNMLSQEIVEREEENLRQELNNHRL